MAKKPKGNTYWAVLHSGEPCFDILTGAPKLYLTREHARVEARAKKIIFKKHFSVKKAELNFLFFNEKDIEKFDQEREESLDELLE